MTRAGVREQECIGPGYRLFEMSDGTKAHGYAADYAAVFAEEDTMSVQIFLAMGDGGLFLSGDRAATRRLIYNLECALDRIPPDLEPEHMSRLSG